MYGLKHYYQLIDFQLTMETHPKMLSETPTTPNPDDRTQSNESSVTEISQSSASSIATTGRRQAFRDIQRQLSESDLSSPGVQKLLLAELERLDSEKEVLEGYRARYFEADRRAAVYEERLKSIKAVDIMFAVCLTFGGACIGLGPALWNMRSFGIIVITIGGILVLTSAFARIKR